MLSYEEFQAEQKRERLKEELKNNKTNTNIKSNKIEKDKNKSSENNNTSTLYVIGEFVESYHVQAIIIVLIILETFLSFSEIIIYNTSKANNNINFNIFNVKINNKHVNLLFQLFESISRFITMIFVVELLLIYLSFGRTVIGHIGYVIDSVIVSIQLYLDIINYRVESKVLNIFRLWRIIRYCNYIINIEIESHNNTKQQVTQKENTINQLNNQIKLLQIDITKEKDSRNAIEDMLAGYKEEVDTLNEALKIAAMDIAEAAQTNIDDELSDDNLDDIDYDDINNNDINNNNDDDDEFVDAPISMYDKSSNINTLIHKITKSNRADNISSNVSIASKSSNSTFTAKSSSNNNKTTFVINQDYSYSKK